MIIFRHTVILIFIKSIKTLKKAHLTVFSARFCFVFTFHDGPAHLQSDSWRTQCSSTRPGRPRRCHLRGRAAHGSCLEGAEAGRKEKCRKAASRANHFLRLVGHFGREGNIRRRFRTSLFHLIKRRERG